MIGLIMLVVLVAYLCVAIAVTRWVVRIPKRAGRKWIIGLISIAVFSLIPTWDVILGRMYFNHLCETEGGVRVYETAELGPEYWEHDSNNLFVNDELAILKGTELVGGHYIYRRKSDEKAGGPGRINRYEAALLDSRTENVVATHTNFIYFGGWLVNGTGLLVRGHDCRDYGYQVGNLRTFLNHVFRPASSGKHGS